MSETAYPDEEQHLIRILATLESAIHEADANVGEIDKDYREVKCYMAENRGEIDPHEMFQNELALKQIDHIGSFAVNSRDRLVKLADSPYFARIDFRAVDDDAAERYYIGRFSFKFRDRLLIFDWRAPISNMFYNCEVGRAGYQAPAGWIEGNLTRKRQFKITAGKLDYVIESSVSIRDDVLQRELSQNSDDRMRSIIGTIQKEQNEIIRDEQAGTMIIQGVAGSGKTSVALHRIAYLLYRFKDRLAADNVMILSPNKVFGNYISNVLPELGEEPICEWNIAEIAAVQADGSINFEPVPDLTGNGDRKRMERAKYKSTIEFFRMLEQFTATAAEELLQPEEYRYNQFQISAAWIAGRYAAYGIYPVKKRLQMVAEDICDRLATDNPMEDELPLMAEVYRFLRGKLNFQTALELYRHFYQAAGMSAMLVLPGRNKLEWEDVYPYLYIYAAFEGVKVSHRIKHLVIDEMQDYTPVQYAVLNIIFPCRKTILGDFGQFINPCHQHSLEDIVSLYPAGTLIHLNKSYRSSYEIISFAGRIKYSDRLQAVERHGEVPQLIACKDRQEEMRRLWGLIDDFTHGGFHTLGIIAKTGQAAADLFASLLVRKDVHLITPASAGYPQGVSVVSVPMAKGLEFDEVIIVDTDSESYATKYDSRLLYVAATRAMHRLSLLYIGELTNLISRQSD